LVKNIQPGNTPVIGSAKITPPVFADIIFRTADANRNDTACQQRERQSSA
jgi:hypothetical protein